MPVAWAALLISSALLGTVAHPIYQALEKKSIGKSAYNAL
jgi:hypothetical protein